MKTPPENSQRTGRRLFLLSVALGAALPLSVMAQDQQGGPPPPPPPGGPRPPSPLMQALDVDKDGTISASEIANAPDALKSLDKNGDGKLTQDELRPPPPPPRGQGGNNKQHKSQDDSSTNTNN